MSRRCPSWCQRDQAVVDPGDQSILIIHTALLGVVDDVAVKIEKIDPEPAELIVRAGGRQVAMPLSAASQLAEFLERVPVDLSGGGSSILPFIRPS